MIDIIIISLYFIFSLFLGLYSSKKSKTLSEYTKVGKDISGSKIILTATFFASAVGGGTTFGIPEKAYATDLAFSYGLLLTIPIDILIGIYIIPRISKFSGVTSIGEIVEKNYGKVGRIITGITASLASTGYLAAQISVCGRIFSSLLNIDYKIAVISSFFMMILYTTIGGFRSVVINNTFQFVAMIIAIPLISIIGIKTIGFFSLLEQIPSYKYDILNNSSLFYNTIYAALSFSVMGFYPSFIQRTLISNKSKPITKAIVYKSFILGAFIIIVSFNGLIADILLPNTELKYVVTSLINEIIPAGFKGIVIVGLLAAVMSTADSDLNISSISLVNDVIKPSYEIKKQITLLILTQIATIAIGCISIILALKFESVVDLVIFSSGFWAPVMLVPLIGLLFGKVISKNAFVVSSIITSFTFIISEIYNLSAPLSSTFTSTIVSLLLFIIFSVKFNKHS